MASYTSKIRVWGVLVVLLTLGAAVRLATYKNKPFELNVSPVILEQGRNDLVAEGFDCTKLKSLKKCTVGSMELTFFSCGPDDGTNKIAKNGVYVMKFDNHSVAPVFHQVDPDAPVEKRHELFKGSMETCPKYPFDAKLKK